MFEQWDAGAAPPRRNSFSEQESACYAGIFRAADPDGTGAVDSERGADLLRRSGLPEPMLRRIWELADPGREGQLPPDRFGVAMRLVAHAQAGQAPSAALGEVEAPRPPEFVAPAAQASPPESGTSSRWDEVSCSSASSRSRRPIRWAPSERETRKYASLFLRTDADGDGFVEAGEARALCDRSGLEEDVLARAWSHADQDGDGRLTFREFVVLVHCVSCCREGLELPPAERGLPWELRAAFAALTKTPEELHRQRSRSSSRSASTSRSASPSPVARSAAPLQTAPPPWLDEGPAWRNEPPLAKSEGSFQAGAALRRGNGYEQQLGSAGGARGSFEEPRKPRMTAAIHEAAPRSPTSPASPSSPSSSSPNSPRFGSDRLRPEAKAPSEVDVQAIGRHLRAMVEADREVLRQVSQEADALEKLVRSEREACAEVKPHVARERDEARHLAELLRQLKQQLSSARQRLSVLQDERRGLGSSSSRSHDRKHFEDMHAFMRQTLEEEERAVEETRHANRQLEQSCASLAGDVAALERQREGILEELLKEEEGHREDERELAGLKTDGHRDGAPSALLGRGEGRRLRSSWDASPLDVAEASPEFSSRHSEPSWASSLVGGNIFAPAVRAAGGPRIGNGDPLLRQGV